MSTGALPWILLGTGAVGITAILVLRKRPLMSLPPGPLTPELKTKVSATIATSNDPALLKQLAAGLQKSGATEDALQALKKAADITGVAQSVPGALSLPTITVQPSAPGIRAPIVGSYKVASGDIPGAIASRFGVSLSSL